MSNNNNFKKLVSISALVFGTYKLFKISTRSSKRENLKNRVVIITGAYSGIGKS